ncbi:MAG: Uma2 family endonuclease [Verrucomicrobiales bacterium]|nr:Uma2 family endonuclease [Verrucomicrobiales bacterium]
MSVALASPSAPSALRPIRETQLPPLENGDRLTRAEFHRRYQAMPSVKKAELIEGFVHMPSPVQLQRHSQPSAHLVTWLGTYSASFSGIGIGDNGTVLLDADNEVQPDAFLFLPPFAGGHARITDDDYLEGSPELVAEVASSSASIDLNAKKTAYRRNGVREYLFWVTREQRIEWWELIHGDFVSLPFENERLIKSRAFPGLWLDAIALLQGDLVTVLAALHEGLATREAQEFRDSLAQGPASD